MEDAIVVTFMITVPTLILGGWIETFLWWRLNGALYTLLGRLRVPGADDLLIPGLTRDGLAGFDGRGEESKFRYDASRGVVLVRRARPKGLLVRSRKGMTAIVLTPTGDDTALRLRPTWAYLPLIPQLSVPIVGLLIGLAGYAAQGDPSGFIFTAITWVMGAVVITANFFITRKHIPELLDQTRTALLDHAARTKRA